MILSVICLVVGVIVFFAPVVDYIYHRIVFFVPEKTYEVGYILDKNDVGNASYFWETASNNEELVKILKLKKLDNKIISIKEIVPGRWPTKYK